MAVHTTGKELIRVLLVHEDYPAIYRSAANKLKSLSCLTKGGIYYQLNRSIGLTILVSWIQISYILYYRTPERSS